MAYLLASLAALVCGPLLDRPAAARRIPSACIDGFIYVSMTGLIAGHILPESFAKAGWQALLFAALGIFGPRLLETTFKRAVSRTHTAAQALGAAGLFAHAMVDGAILSTVPTTGTAIGLAVVLHRIPAGMTLWWLVRRSHGGRIAGALLGIMGVATIVGYGSVASLGDMLSPRTAGYFEALVAGSLLHVVLHRVADQAETRRGLKEGIGALLGVGMLVALFPGLAAVHGQAGHDHAGHDHAAHAHAHAMPGADFARTFLDLFYETAPALVLAFVAAGLVQVFLPKFSERWMSRGGSFSSALRGVAFGLPLPICSCGVVPVYRSLVKRGVAPAAGIAFLVATPELGLDAILISLPLLGADLAIARVVAAAVLAVTVGWLVGGRIAARKPDAEEERSIPTGSAGARLIQALRIGATEIFDATGPWILFGIAIAAFCAPLLSDDLLTGIPAALQVPAFALLGMPIYVCASGATPLVAVLIAKGASPGAALAFLLTGPATNVTTFGLLSRLHGRRAAFAFAVTITTATIAMGLCVDLLLETGAAGTVVAHEHDGVGPVQRVAGVVLALMLAFSLLRRGPRAFVGQVVSWAGGHDHASHDHHDGDDSHEKGDDGKPSSPEHSCCD